MSSMASERNLQPALDAIRVKFLASLETRLAELDALTTMIKSGDKGSRVWEEVRLRVHRIAGVAGSLGFSALGARSARLDTAIEQYIAEPSSADEATILAALDDLLDDIDAILEDGN